jgi:uncharacterized protein (DUF1330 family)
MGRYDEIEPLPHIIAAVADLDTDREVKVVGLMRLRRDTADGAADTAFRAWRQGIAQVMARVGARTDLMGGARFVMVGEADAWDYVAVFTYPNPRALLKALGDEQLLDLVPAWRAAVEDVHMVVVGDPPDG